MYSDLVSPSCPAAPRCRVAKPRILFTSVFGPYAQDDEHGSRAINPMELNHNQVTRVQGAFSLRMFHRSWGLMMIRDNVHAPNALLDFPTLDRFISELKNERYDVVAISAIPPNFLKAEKMCRLIREHQPHAEIVVGGHISGLPDIRERLGADYVVRGEGVRWFREFLGEDPDAPVKHPRIASGIGARTMGIRLREKPGDTAATIIPSVGCPMGCNFCATSAMFGGKGKFVNFYETGDELFQVMEEIERDMHVQTFFMMDENFLLHRKRALRLLELMKAAGKSWSLYVFSSANVLKSYTMEQLVGLGVSWVWMGLEGKESRYHKLHGADTMEVVKTLQANGISVLGSTIIGLEEHSPDNLEEAIEHAVSHDTEFHQFMLYTPVPGTPLFEEHKEKGTLLDPEWVDGSDVHGQLRFTHVHPQLPQGSEGDWLLRAFRRDFEVNGPSILRMARTALQGWMRYGNDADRRVRARFRREAGRLRAEYAAAVWAVRRYFRNQPDLRSRADDVLRRMREEFGLRCRIFSSVGGRWLYRMVRREDKRLARGVTYEPPTFYELSPDFEDSRSLATR